MVLSHELVVLNRLLQDIGHPWPTVNWTSWGLMGLVEREEGLEGLYRPMSLPEQPHPISTLVGMGME